MQMLAKDPAQRPASAQAVADTLYDMAADDTQAMTPPAGMPVLTLEPKTAATKTRRRWWLPVAFGVALTAVAGALLWNFGGFDFTWRTPHGTLYLTVEETGVEVFIDGVKKMILDTKTHGKIELTPGPRQLAVKRDGKTLYIESFTIKSNGKKAIQARWIPKTPPDNGKKPPVTASVLDGLDPAKIPAHERFPWQPENLVAVLGTHRQSHEWYVHRVAYLHNGEIIASASDAWLRLWDSKTMNLIAEKNESTLFLAVAPDGKGMACRDRDGVQIWTLSEDRKKLNKGPLLRHDAPVIAAASSPARNLMATVTFDSKSGAQIYVWDMKGPVQIAGREAAQTKKVRTIDFSRDGMLLATGDEMQRMQLWRFDDDKKRLQQVKNCHQMHKNGPVVSIAFNPDSKFLASIERIKYNGSVHLWRFDGTVLTAIKAPQELKADDFVTAAFSPTSDLLALAMGRRRIQLWEIQNGKPKKIADTLGKGFGQIQSMDFSPDGNHLVTASTTGMVRQWKIPRLNGKLEETMKAKAPIGPVDALAFLPGDREIVLGCYDGTLRVYDLTKPQPQEKTAWKAHSGYVTSVGYVPETKVLVSGAYKDRAKVWKMSKAGPTTKPVYTFPTPDVWSVAVSPTTPNRIALGHADGVIRFYDLSDLSKPEKWHRSKLDTHAQAGVDSWVTALEYSRDGFTLASSNAHGEPQIGISRLNGKALVRQPSNATEIGASSTHPFAISPDGGKLYVGDHHKIGVYELPKTGERTFVRNIALTGKNRIRPYHLVCSQDALYIGDSHEIAEWKNNKIERRWKVPGIIRAMALSHDGRHLATAHYNGTVYILRVNLSP